MANAKIYGIAMTILDVMTDVFLQDYRDFVFACLLDPGDVVEMVIFDLIKMTYDKTEEKHSMRYFLKSTELRSTIRLCAIAGFSPMFRSTERENLISEQEKRTMTFFRK